MFVFVTLISGNKRTMLSHSEAEMLQWSLGFYLHDKYGVKIKRSYHETVLNLDTG